MPFWEYELMHLEAVVFFGNNASMLSQLLTIWIVETDKQWLNEKCATTWPTIKEVLPQWNPVMYARQWDVKTSLNKIISLRRSQVLNKMEMFQTSVRHQKEAECSQNLVQQTASSNFVWLTRYCHFVTNNGTSFQHPDFWQIYDDVIAGLEIN